jgi:phosphoenolpyruvate synthase/pyruvate phosphate dikinase
MHAATGILTSTGGMTSHAAVVARGWGKPCICGCEALSLDYKAKTATVNGSVLQEGSWISLNGTTGEVISGQQVRWWSTPLMVAVDLHCSTLVAVNMYLHIHSYLKISDNDRSLVVWPSFPVELRRLAL